jgi:HSP20 family protein
MMTKLIRWEPFRDMRRMHDMLDRMMDRSFLDWPLYGREETEGFLPLDVYQTDENVIVKATVPGIKAEDIQISITGDTLTIRGEANEEKEEEGAEYYLRERRSSKFARSITLPTSINADSAKAEFEDGVLLLTLPKIEEVKPKTITVKAK